MKNLLLAAQKLFSWEKTIVPSLQCFRSDPFGVRGRGILTPSSLKGWLSPSRSPSMGTPLLQQISLSHNGFSPETDETPEQINFDSHSELVFSFFQEPLKGLWERSIG